MKYEYSINEFINFNIGIFEFFNGTTWDIRLWDNDIENITVKDIYQRNIYTFREMANDKYVCRSDLLSLLLNATKLILRALQYRITID